MISNFSISNFKLFKNVTFDSLERINIIAGLNNVGKTSFLEALWIHFGAHNPELLLRTLGFRGFPKLAFHYLDLKNPFIDSFYYNFDLRQEIVFQNNGDPECNRTTCIRLVQDMETIQNVFTKYGYPPGTTNEDWSSSDAYFALEAFQTHRSSRESSYLFISAKGVQLWPIPAPASFQCIFLTSGNRVLPEEENNRFSALKANKKHDIVIDALKTIDNRIRGIDILVYAGTYCLHADIGLPKLMPLAHLGQGAVRLVNYILAITEAMNGIVLIDEAESGLHYSAYPNLWKMIDFAAKEYNVQIFCTTHSRECALAAHSHFREQDEYSMRYFRIDTIRDESRVVGYEKDVMEAAIEMNMEIR